MIMEAIEIMMQDLLGVIIHSDQRMFVFHCSVYIMMQVASSTAAYAK